MIKVTDLKSGDEVLGWMRLGFAITKTLRGDATVQWEVPLKAQSVSRDDIDRFIGLVSSNDTNSGVLNLSIHRMNEYKRLVPGGPQVVVALPYWSLKRLRLISKVAKDPKSDNPTFPANFVDARFRAFKTTVEVKL